MQSAIRDQWGHDEQEEVWEDAAFWAAEEENYQLALQLVGKSALATRLQPLYQLLCDAERYLSCTSFEVSSLRELDKAESLRKAMKKRNAVEIKRCLASFFDNGGNGGDSPGSGVPTRPRPPNLPANERRNWPHSPPPL